MSRWTKFMKLNTLPIYHTWDSGPHHIYKPLESPVRVNIIEEVNTIIDNFCWLDGGITSGLNI